MNPDERIAEKYLNTIGNVVFEPDGNIPPDFVVDENIAIEVRRLNQNRRTMTSVKGLEETGIPFISALENELTKYQTTDTQKKYWLSIRYKRDIGNIAYIKKNLKLAFSDFETGGEKIPSSYKLSQNVEIVIAAEAGNTDKKYSFGIFNDYDSGGWVIDMYSKEINHCAAEKSQKILPYILKYSEWWLVLVDHLNFMDVESHKATLGLISKPNNFHKIIVINGKSESILEV